MKSNAAKKASITLPVALEKELKKLAIQEHRTLSGVLQEAARHYVALKHWESFQAELAPKAFRAGINNEDDVVRMIHQLRN